MRDAEEGQPTKPEFTLTITLPDYNQELQYVIQRQSEATVIEPQFDYKHEECRYIIEHLFSEKRLAKQATKEVRLSVPQSHQEREALADLENEELAVPIKVEPQDRQAAIDAISSKRRQLICHILCTECQPLANLTPEERRIVASFSLEDRRVFADFLLEMVEKLRPSAAFPHAEPHWGDEVAVVVFAALNLFELDALRLSTANELIVRQQNDIKFRASMASGRASVPPRTNTRQTETFTVEVRTSPEQKALASDALASLDRLGSVIGEVIRDWQRRVREARDSKGRSQSQKNLRRVGNALIPDTRGMRKQRVGVSALEVKKHYYRELFRCEQAKALLRQTETLPGCGRWESRLQMLCESFNLSCDPGWWGFSEKGQVLRQLLKANESAILLTARHFPPAKEQTIRNIVSSLAKSLSRLHFQIPEIGHISVKI